MTHYVSELPVHLHSSEPKDKLVSFATLGPMLVTKGPDLWQTDWHQLDRWIYNQLLISPRRVYDMAAADVVVVPIAPRLHEFNTMMRAFMETAVNFLPLLGKKPHIIALNHPVHVYDEFATGVMDLPAVRHFTILTMQAEVDRRFPQMFRKRDVSNMVITPNLMQVHWHRGHELMLTNTNYTRFDAAATAARKKLFATASGKVRP
jgi:hypothetical protein